ncbi:MAG: hypothetical protein QN163_07530 [Armatimonadota bacterium]|nr:hypothetical protein [Armatimonadota bacterium]MDR5696942.1 hypothetical protein [Armatimonadota bacterium]
MNASGLLDSLATADGRRRFGLWMLALCLAGALATAAVLGWHRWFFAVILWLGGVYVPARLVAEVLGARGRRMQDRYRQALPDRITRGNLPLVARGLYERDVLMPRIVTPPYAAKVTETVIAVGNEAFDRADAGEEIRRAAVRFAAVADGWMSEMRLVREADPASTNIQARWHDIRSLSVLAAATRVLVALYEEIARQPFYGPAIDAQQIRDFLDASLDYLDRAAIDPDVPPWTGSLLGLWTAESTELRARWDAFVSVQGPAPSRISAVLEIAMGPR